MQSHIFRQIVKKIADAYCSMSGVFCGKMEENIQADFTQSLQSGFVRCCLNFYRQNKNGDDKYEEN